MTEILVLRVERPYSTESEFLHSENWTITKKSMFLIGVPSHPEGTIARCELLLSSGIQLLVAEGTVAKFVPASADRPAGLVVRYRRLTPASSQFVNRALNNRDVAEASSPSAAEHRPIVSNSQPRQTEATGVSYAQSDQVPRIPAMLIAASESRRNTRDILQRLSERQHKTVQAPLNRATLLSRLRMRAANGSNH